MIQFTSHRGSMAQSQKMPRRLTRQFDLPAIASSTQASWPRLLHGRSLALYELIWRRTVASQMADAKLSTTTAKFNVKHDGQELEFSASGTTVLFKGFLAAYDESTETKEEEAKLPKLDAGQELVAKDVLSKNHSTQPPARYTEASLVKALEEQGIGRPSTYAAIISTIISKGYVVKRGNALVPEWISFHGH
jgi:DNA topoisomerase I